jgi:hypothetical protein
MMPRTVEQSFLLESWLSKVPVRQLRELYPTPTTVMFWRLPFMFKLTRSHIR